MPRRSRGCLPCKQGRKKCDGMMPSCQRCLRLNRHCSGPVQGPVIVNETGRVVMRYKKSSPSVESPSGNIPIVQPSHKVIITSAFLSEFISGLTSFAATPTKPTWLIQLDDIPQAQRGTALDLSLHATATAYCAVQANNPSAIREACRMYGQALSLHSRSIAQQSKAPSTADICTSVILSMFEAIWATSDESYCFHLTAAREMIALSVADPLDDPFHGKLLRHIYTYVSYQSVFTLVTSTVQCLRSGALVTKSNSALLWQLPSGAQSVVDRLLIQLVKLGKVIPIIIFERPEMCNQLYDIVADIRALWDEYQADAIVRGESIQYEYNGEMMYRDDDTALTLAYFASVNIMISLTGLWTDVDSPFFIEEQCRSIIDCALYLFRIPAAVPSASLPMLLPITLAALHSPSGAHREQASLLLKTQLLRANIKGLVSRAVEAVETSRSGTLNVW